MKTLDDFIGKENCDGIEQSKVFISLFSKNLRSDPIPIIQLGYAIMLDKPIYLIVLDGEKVPENIKRVAMHIEYIKDRNDKNELKNAIDKLAKMFKEHSLMIH